MKPRFRRDPYTGHFMPLNEPSRAKKRVYDARRAAICKTWYNRMASNPVRYADYLEKRRAYKKSRPRKCRSCGQKRRKFSTYCEECKKAFRHWSLTAAGKRRRKKLKDAKRAKDS